MSWGLPHHPSMGGFPKVTTTGRGLKAKASTAQYFSFALNDTKGQPLSLLSDVRQSQISLTACMTAGFDSFRHTHTQKNGARHEHSCPLSRMDRQGPAQICKLCQRGSK